MRNEVFSLFSYVLFPSMYLNPFPFHLLFQKTVFHNAAGLPRPEGQLQAPRGTVGLYTYLPGHGMMDQTACCAWIAPTARLRVKANARDRHATELSLCVPC